MYNYVTTINNKYLSDYVDLQYTSARPEVRGTADVGWRSLFPLPLNHPRTHSRLHMCFIIIMFYPVYLSGVVYISLTASFTSSAKSYLYVCVWGGGGGGIGVCVF